MSPSDVEVDQTVLVKDPRASKDGRPARRNKREFILSRGEEAPARPVLTTEPKELGQIAGEGPSWLRTLLSCWRRVWVRVAIPGEVPKRTSRRLRAARS